MNNEQIAIYVAGNKNQATGFVQRVSVGILAGNETKGLDDPPCTSSKENPVIILKNADGYVFYKIWDNSIYPSDSTVRLGNLAIGMTMPSNARLRDGKSPYRLLMDIYNKFLEIGTVTDDSGRVSFKDETIDKAEFIKIIESYPFDTVSVKPEVMKGEATGEICIPKEKMDDFFRDAQYPEFVGYKAIEVTTLGRNMFPSLQIPRPKRYEVFYDGISTGKFLVQRDDKHVAHKEEANGQRYDSLTFTLGDLLDSQNHSRKNQQETVFVKLDEDRCRIDCTFIAKDIDYTIQLSFDKDTDTTARQDISRWYKEGYVKIRKNDRPFIDKNGNPCDKIKHEDAKQAIKNAKTEYPTIDIFPNEIEGYRLSVEDLKITGDSFQIVVKAAKTDAAKEKIGQGLRGTGNLLTMRELVVLLVGLALGIGGMCGLNYWKHTKEVKERIATAKSAENKAYAEATKLPVRNKNIKDGIGEQDSEYLDLLQTANGIHPYYEYLKNYGTDNKDAYNATHYNDIISRRNTYQADSAEYVTYLAQQAANKENLGKANAAFNKIKEENSKKKPDYAKIISLCEDYPGTYKGVSPENDTEVANILANAQKKQETAAAADETRKQVEQEALKFLNNNDYNGFTVFYNRNTNVIGKIKRNAVAWILDYKNNVDKDENLKGPEKAGVKNNIESYLKEKGYDDGSNKFESWNEVISVKDEIDNILNKKGN